MSELDKEMNKFVHQLELEKSTEKNVVFISDKLKLNSATNFSQYIFEDSRLVTLIGEKHEQSWKCPEPSISIAEYCKHAVERNPRCKIMLEYDKSADASLIGSKAIRDIFASLKSINKQSQIIPFEVRGYFLTPQGQNKLYDSSVFDYSFVDLQKNFVDPYYITCQRDKQVFSLPGKYDSRITDFLFNRYLPDVTRSFEYAKHMIIMSENKKKVIQILRDTWKKVTDFYVLRDVLQRNQYDEFIIILGRAHYLNIQGVLQGFMVELENKVGGPKNCVELFQTYRF